MLNTKVTILNIKIKGGKFSVFGPDSWGKLFKTLKIFDVFLSFLIFFGQNFEQTSNPHPKIFIFTIKRVSLWNIHCILMDLNRAFSFGYSMLPNPETQVGSLS